MNKFYLVGIPGCGKTTLGKRVAECLNMPFFDTDKMAKNKLGDVSYTDMFKLFLHGHFSREEKNAVIEVAGYDEPAIVATGAEVGLVKESVEIMKSTGYIIHIKRETQSILNEMEGKPSIGFVLVDRNNENGEKPVSMQKLAVIEYAKCLAEYEMAADLNFSNYGSEDEGVEKLALLIQMIMESETEKTVPLPPA